MNVSLSSPNINRWMTRDPLGNVAGPNLFAYLNNNVLNYADPFGLTALGLAGCQGLPTPNTPAPDIPVSESIDFLGKHASPPAAGAPQGPTWSADALVSVAMEKAGGDVHKAFDYLKDLRNGFDPDRLGISPTDQALVDAEHQLFAKEMAMTWGPFAIPLVPAYDALKLIPYMRENQFDPLHGSFGLATTDQPASKPTKSSLWNGIKGAIGGTYEWLIPSAY
jgi:hypothetical protein